MEARGGGAADARPKGQKRPPTLMCGAKESSTRMTRQLTRYACASAFLRKKTRENFFSLPPSLFLCLSSRDSLFVGSKLFIAYFTSDLICLPATRRGEGGKKRFHAPGFDLCPGDPVDIPKLKKKNKKKSEGSSFFGFEAYIRNVVKKERN